MITDSIYIYVAYVAPAPEPPGRGWPLTLVRRLTAVSLSICRPFVSLLQALPTASLLQARLYCRCALPLSMALTYRSESLILCVPGHYRSTSDNAGSPTFCVCQLSSILMCRITTIRTHLECRGTSWGSIASLLRLYYRRTSRSTVASLLHLYCRPLLLRLCCRSARPLTDRWHVFVGE